MNIVEQLFGKDRLSEIGPVPALKWADGCWTYQRLAAEIESAGAEFIKRGVEAGQRVVFQCADTAEFVAWYFGSLRIGAIGIAVSTRLDGRELAYVIDDSEARAIVYDASAVGARRLDFDGEEAQLIHINLDDAHSDCDASQHLATVVRSVDDEAFWVYSSGSTGRSKGIVHSHNSIRDGCGFHSNILRMSSGDLLFCTSKLSFAYALANGLLAPLQLGATIYLHPDWVTPEAFRHIIRTERPRVVMAVPSIYRNLLNRIEEDDAELLSIPEDYVSAGEHLPAELRIRWEAICERTIINGYGCSETLFLALAGDSQNTPPNSVGKPLPRVEIELLDASGAATIAPGEQGLLHLSHPFMFLRYANRSRVNMRQYANGRFNTGDLFRRGQCGNWYHLGRTDERIKVAGQWVDLREIEKVSRQSSVAADVAVVGAKDDVGLTRAALFFIPDIDDSFDQAVAMMRKQVERNLPNFKCPSWIRAIDEFPKTANGKLSRSELQQLVEGQGCD